MENLYQAETDSPLPPDAQDRLEQFKAFAARHPRLDLVEHEVLHTIWEPAGCAYLLVYGPSGVGKSTMIHHIVRRLNTPAGGTGYRPLLLLEVRPPDGELFHRTDYYRTALRRLGQTAFERRMMVDLNTEHTWEKKGGRRMQSSGASSAPVSEERRLLRATASATMVSSAIAFWLLRHTRRMRGEK
jgi:hypothetical protein